MKKTSTKIPEKLKDLVKDAIKRHAWNIGVSHYTGDIHWMQEDVEGDGIIAAEITVNRRYLKFTLKIYPDTVKKWHEQGDQYVEEVIAHEIAHLATHHFYDVATARYCDDGEMKDAWETCTQVIGQLSYRLNNMNQKTK